MRPEYDFSGGRRGAIEALPADFLDRPVSPTALEEWVNNPFGYFVTKVLGAELFADRELAQQQAGFAAYLDSFEEAHS